MSIVKTGKLFAVVCDICGDEGNEQYDFFYDAVQGRKESGYISRKIGDDWEDICVECQPVK